MKKLTILFLASAVLIATAFARDQKLPIVQQKALDENSILFVPQGYDAKNNPSFAFEKPLKTVGPVPKNWKLVPHFSSHGTSTKVVLDVPFQASLYGTGEVTGSLLRNGKEITLWNTDNSTYGTAHGRRLYQSHPWVLGVRLDGSAFGIIFDTTWKAKLQTTSHQIILMSEGPPCRVVILEGKTPQALVRKLADLTGKMPLPPKWAIGFQQCRYSYYPDSKVREIADQYRARHLPCDVIWLDIHFMDGYRDFTFDPERFPDPKATNDYLHKHGFHSVWIVDPAIKIDPNYFVYQQGSNLFSNENFKVGSSVAGLKTAWVLTKNGQPFQGEVWPGKSVFPDYTMPEVRHWWSGLYHNFLAQGIDGVWNDMNEPSVFTGPHLTMPEDNWHRGGGGLPAGIHRMYHNVYGMLMASATRAGILHERPDKRPFLLSRSNYLGGQRYATTWTGDNSSGIHYLKMSIPMGLNLGLSGSPFNGVDLGGYAGKENPDLFGKWIVMSAFFPFSRAHTATYNPPREPWVFGPKIENVTRTSLERRYRMLPYLYTLFYKASQHGDPIMQPVFFADPKNLLLRSEDQAFLLGADLLVVPRWARFPRLPGGIWRDVSLLPGKQEEDGYQPRIKIRGGAIVPLGRVIQNTNEESLKPLTLLVCLDEKGEARGSLYEDAGEGFGYKNGDYALTHYHAIRKGKTVTVTMEKREGSRFISDRPVHVQLIVNGPDVEATGLESQRIVLKLNKRWF
ncbi:MAG: TIM-barrel domain-containing protein [Verrucomicrobiota bacterium]